MVDELAYGLSLLGEEVWVISPYYEKNRKGETGYLAKDPAGIEYKENIKITLNKEYTLGVHEGEVHGVKVIFLHHSEIFPIPYPDANCLETVKQLAVFGKACLEFCCARSMIPSLCITNDWFTGLIPAYAKIGAFGETFKGTTFLHIAHNLEPTYEGRIFPSPQDGALENIH
jgi:starch synthase